MLDIFLHYLSLSSKFKEKFIVIDCVSRACREEKCRNNLTIACLYPILTVEPIYLFIIMVVSHVHLGKL